MWILKNSKDMLEWAWNIWYHRYR